MSDPTAVRDGIPAGGARAGISRREIAAVLAAALVSRFVVFAIVFIESQFAGDSLLSDLCRWDCLRYASIADLGYDLTPPTNSYGQADWAFFPAFPLLSRGLLAVFGLSPEGAAVVTSNLMFLAACPVLYGYVKRFFGAVLAFDTVLLVSVSPFSLYYSAGYTESLFLMATIASLWCWEGDRYLLGGTFGALAAATRSVGLSIPFAFIVILATKRRHELLAALRHDSLRIIVGLALVPLGLALYMIHLHNLTGDALAFAHVQIAWKLPLDPWSMMRDGLRPPSPYYLVTTAAGALCFILGAYLVALRRYGDATLLMVAAGASLILKIAAGTGMLSMTRYAFGLFPIYIAIAALLSRFGVPRWLYLTVAAGFLGFYATGWSLGQAFAI